MSTDVAIEDSIESAAEAVGPAWPLHSFVTANPLAGFEDQPFHEAVAEAEGLLGGNGYPGADVFRAAWETGRVDPAVLESHLSAHGYDLEPETSLHRMATGASAETTDAAAPATERVDAILTKWLGTFLDQGQAHWEMPNREAGFYEAFRTVAPHDGEIPDGERVAELPDEPVETIRDCLDQYPVGQWREIFEFHLAALPGWTGFIKRRIDENDDWQSAYPITLAGYLAVRLVLADLFDAPVAPSEAADDIGGEAGGETGDVPLPEVWLRAWEATYRSELVEAVTDASEATADAPDGERPDAQLVFCIDTRSEIIRRHVEAAGDYETHGFAGFFGIPIRYVGYDADVTVDACPPILDAEHRIEDRPAEGADEQNEYDRWHATLEAGKDAIESLKSNAATAFNFVEGAGAGYGTALTARTLLPGRVHDILGFADDSVPDVHEFCDPAFDADEEADHELPAGLTLEERVEYAATAFDLMGWEKFARIVVFAGHASQTANNPYDSSLDCGACAGNPGGPNARVLAAICNDEAVREKLRERGIDVPEDTVFVAGQHNTTTDEVELYAGNVPESHAEDIEQLRADLATARAGATAERAGDMGADPDSGLRETERRASDWAQTRPEWGLAGNAAFVIGPRSLTAGLDLDGRSFLHSYDWHTDPDGDALEAIMLGPMVVTQWINTQYYFATVDNAVYGSGSKVTHNPVGNVGVYQGNGGALQTGLPLQSLMSADEELYHLPLRLSVVVHAPVECVDGVLSEHEQLTDLLDNGWLSLTVVDPQRDHRALRYESDIEWRPLSEEAAGTPERVHNAAESD